MIKAICIIVISLLTSQLWSQTNDVDSVRWLRVQNSENNNQLFDFKGMNDSTLFGSVWKSAYYGDRSFFLESKDISDKQPKYIRLFKFPQTDSLEIDSCITYPWDLYEYQFSNAIVFALDYDNPMTDVNGNEIIVFDEAGVYFTYPPRTYTVIPISEISEIRIKEVRILNEISNEFEYKPVAIQLTPQLVSRMGYTIWIDLGKMQDKTPGIENHGWYSFIRNGNYEGIKFMQLINSTGLAQ